MNKLLELWHNLPKTAKVSCYIIASAAISETIKILSGLGVNDMVMAGVINVLIVALVELKKGTEVTEE